MAVCGIAIASEGPSAPIISDPWRNHFWFHSAISPQITSLAFSAAYCKKTYFANTKLTTIFLFNERGLYRHGTVYQFYIGLGVQATSSNVNSVNKSSNDKISVSGIENEFKEDDTTFKHIQTHFPGFFRCKIANNIRAINFI